MFFLISVLWLGVSLASTCVGIISWDTFAIITMIFTIGTAILDKD